jgi:hypothetical protein
MPCDFFDATPEEQNVVVLTSATLRDAEEADRILLRVTV